MYDGRKLIDQLREIFQDRVDGLERSTGEHLDRLVTRSAEHLSAHRADLDASPARNRSRHPDARDEDRKERRQRARDRKHERHHRRRHRRHARRRGRAAERDLDPAEIEERRILRRARARANRRIGFLSHFVTYVGVLTIILVASRSIRAVMITALAWGIGLFLHYLMAIAAPKLRDRWVSDEVVARSPRAVASERQKVETRSRRSMEDLSASIAHEIRNPITAAKSLVQQMGEDPASRENIEYAEVALSELDRVERSISHLLRYARDEEPRFERLALEDVAVRAAEGMHDRARTAGIDVHVEFDRPGVIHGDPEKIRRVFENLISNAIDALTDQPIERPRIEILGGENLAGTEVWIRFIDNGPGIPAEDRERIWSPFHTTKESGTGLGLALSRKTVEAHGGRMELEPSRAHGTEFVVSFPTIFESADGQNDGSGLGQGREAARDDSEEIDDDR
jgi:signal transduction histidine kinase